MRRNTVISIAITLLTASSARAIESRVGFDTGWASAVGFGGPTFAIAPTSHFELEAGVGYGWTGVQLSTLPRLVVPLGNERLLLGLGPSLSLCPVCENGSPTLWANLELGLEHVFHGGFSMWGGVGGTLGLAGRYAQRCAFWSCKYETEYPAAFSLTWRTGVGYWF
jgi:hypothetical protein